MNFLHLTHNYDLYYVQFSNIHLITKIDEIIFCLTGNIWLVKIGNEEFIFVTNVCSYSKYHQQFKEIKNICDFYINKNIVYSHNNYSTMFTFAFIENDTIYIGKNTDIYKTNISKDYTIIKIDHQNNYKTTNCLITTYYNKCIYIYEILLQNETNEKKYLIHNLQDPYNLEYEIINTPNVFFLLNGNSLYTIIMKNNQYFIHFFVEFNFYKILPTNNIFIVAKNEDLYINNIKINEELCPKLGFTKSARF